MRLDIETNDSDLIRFKVAKKGEELSEKLIKDIWGEFDIKDIKLDNTYGNWMKVTFSKSAALELIKKVNFRVRVRWKILIIEVLMCFCYFLQ